MEWIERPADLEIEWFEAGALLYCDCGGRVCLVNDIVSECLACHGEYRLVVKVEEVEETLEAEGRENHYKNRSNRWSE